MVTGTLISAIFVNCCCNYYYYQIMLSKHQRIYTHWLYFYKIADKDTERKERLFIPVNLSNLIISNNIYYLLCASLSVWYVTDITKFHFI